MIPPEMREHYTEKVAYMPFTYQPNDRHRPIADKQSQPRRMRPAARWLRLLLLQRHLQDHAGTVRHLDADPQARGRVDPLASRRRSADRGQFQQRGGRPRRRSERIIFAPALPLPAHLGRHRFADLFLDTAPYNAHTTASDALWAGLPVLTLHGTRLAGAGRREPLDGAQAFPNSSRQVKKTTKTSPSGWRPSPELLRP